MPLLDLQRRGRQIGRIRIGQKVTTSKGKIAPGKLDTFRLTIDRLDSAQVIAATLGGEAKAWQKGQFEVITTTDELQVMIPPGQVITQWYELWSKGGAQRRCDSVTERLSGKPCLCPHAADPTDEDEVQRAALERSQLAKLNPPKACKIITRLNVVIPDLPGLGVWRLDTSSFYAAGEMQDTAEVLQIFRDQGGMYLPARLFISQRERIAGGKTTPYPVPVLDVSATFRQLATRQLGAGGIQAMLPPAPPEKRQAITAGSGSKPEQQIAPAALKVGPPPSAQDLADQAAKATTRQQIVAIKAVADEHAIADDAVNTSLDTDLEVFEELDLYLQARWRELPDATTEPRDEVA
jgi:hypothetical protein